MNPLVGSLFKLRGTVVHILHDNSPVILTAIGVSGTVSTAYLAGKASYEAALVIRDEEAISGTADDRNRRIHERVGLVWKLYIPAGVSGGLTIAAIIAATTVSTRRTAAMAAAYSLSDKALTEYKDKVTEKLGEKKEVAVRDEIAQDRVRSQPPTNNELVMVGQGTVLCYELLTGRYFSSSMEVLKRAENAINAKLLRETYVPLGDFYYAIGVAETSRMSDDMGWDSNKLMELTFSSVLAEDGQPCLAIDYNYLKPI